MTRILMSMVLRDRDATPGGTALSALLLLWMRNALRDLHQVLPDGNFDVLNSPLVAPAFIIDFVNRK
jgi:hypothetical protein